MIEVDDDGGFDGEYYQEPTDANPFNNPEKYVRINPTTMELMGICGIPDDCIAYLVLDDEKFAAVGKYIGGHIHAS